MKIKLIVALLFSLIPIISLFGMTEEEEFQTALAASAQEALEQEAEREEIKRAIAESLLTAEQEVIAQKEPVEHEVPIGEKELPAPEVNIELAGEKEIKPQSQLPVKSKRQAINAGEYHITGRRQVMQDASLMQVPFYPKRPNSGVFAVFDGHGKAGDEIAQYGAENLVRALKLNKAPAKEMLQKGLSQLNEDLKERADADESGTCAIVALVNGKEVSVANIGDSRAILSRNGGAIKLSEDQVPTRPDEKARIEAEGGRVNVKLLNGVLAVSRAIGDFYQDEFGLSHEPELESIVINPDTDFLILACDGIFERGIMTSQDAVDIVKKALEENQDNTKATEIAAQALVDEAYKRGSKDNLSAIVVTFAAD